MQYIVSKNLKHEYKLKNHMYKLLPMDNCVSDAENYFCGECRHILSFKDTSNIVCPHCGVDYNKYKRNENEANVQDIPLAYLCEFYSIDKLIDSVTINKSFSDDGKIRDINVTILYHSYKIDSDLQHQISWQHYDRILFNFETKQVYYTNKLSLSKKVDFEHFKIYEECTTRSSIFSAMIPSIIKEIYDSYGIACTNTTWYNSTPVNMQSSKIAFMCLKFPIMMNYAYDLWISYKRRKNVYYNVDMYISIIYWACNYDRVLKKALTSTTEKEYVERTDEIMHGVTNDSNLIKSVRNNPLYIVYARYMHQLGFDSFYSVKRVVDYILPEEVSKTNVSVWVYDMVCQRTHIRNKMYRRFLKTRSEDDVLDMLFNAKSKCIYVKYFSGYNQRFEINKFYYILEQKLNKIDFSNDIDYIFDSIT